MTWGQYRLDDDPSNTLIGATTDQPVDPDTIAAAGKGQILLPDDAPIRCTMDRTVDPPVFKPLTS